METPGYKGFSVSEEDAIACIPESLYMLLRLIVGGQASLEDDSPGNNEEHVRSIVLSVAQRKPSSLQKPLSAEYTMCTQQTLLMQHGIYCSPRRGNQKPRPQQVMRSVSI